MKNLVLIFAISTLFIGCVKDNPRSEGDDLVHLANTHIPIDELVSFINPNYRDNQTVVFTNDAGGEIRYNIQYGFGTTPRTEHGINYMHDFFVIQLKSPDAPMTGLEIRGEGIYSQKGNITKSISVSFEPKVLSGSNFVRVYFENGVAIITELDNFSSSIVLNGKEFRDVFSSLMFLTGNEAYSEIKINEFEGIISFKDDRGVQWVFERFEN